MFKPNISQILGASVYLQSQADELSDAALAELFESGGFSVAINAEKVLANRRIPELNRALARADFPYLDGKPLALLARLAGHTNADTIDMPVRALQVAERFSLNVGLLGASAENVLRAQNNVKSRFPDIAVSFAIDGYKSDEELLQIITTQKADVVLLALGSPRQELLAFQARSAGFPGFVVPCGGALDILAGQKSRAPLWIHNAGLETPYRLLQDPSRLGRYQSLLPFIVRFPSALLQALLKSEALEEF
ncbi:WecB/TagA/CpsF family glycosyltransferase [Congregibacter brevis]|uniref:WecB/TagA/CpsF family glycosyltransferase n=1 Tax=Congregibacter brevis TaxID=3081201 RepID=A0ABZ0ICT8_9GAMM|nr:WecB/TagA/CpsF family glycosyltransferase [Congregibacter sp. IMCC45268]